MIKVDNTLLCDIAKCDAAGIARHVLKLRGLGEKIAADIGNVFHAGLEAYFLGKSREEVMRIFDLEFNKVVPAGQEAEKPNHGRENCRRIMLRFMDTRPIDRFPFTVIEAEKTVGVKLTDEIEIYVKRDLLVQDKNTGMFAPLDHKTRHGAITEWWMKKFRMSSQMSGYCWVTGQLTGQPVLECYVNAVEIQKIPDSNRKCIKHKVPFAECGIEHVKFELLTYSRTPEMIERWRQDAILVAGYFAHLVKAYPTVEYLPFARRNGAFNDGCTFCEFKSWCGVGFAANLANSYVISEEWAPWDKGEGKVTASDLSY